MSTGKREAFYHSGPWRRARDAYLKRRIAIDGGLCEVCHYNLGDTVHHKTWLTDENVDDPEIALNEKNFCLICRDCHAKERDPKAQRTGRYYFDSDGNIVPTAPIEK